jgi:hypothetical protein
MNIISVVTKFLTDVGKTRLTLSTFNFTKLLTKRKDESKSKDLDKTAVKSKPNKFLDLLTSPGVGTILTVFGVVTCLYSPLGIAIGGTVAAITTISYSLSMIRSTLRMRTIKNTQNKDLLLDTISAKIQISSERQLNPQFKKMVNEEIKKVIDKRISNQKVIKQNSTINSISSSIRYLSLTGAANWMLSIITLNPVSIAISSTSMIVSNGLSYHGEINYRKDKDVLEKENKLIEYLKIELGIEDKFINKLSNKDLLKILSIKEAELACHKKSYNSLEDMQKAFSNNIKVYQDINLEEFPIQKSFTQDFINLFSNSFSSEKYEEFFCPLIRRQEKEQLEQRTYSKIVASYKNDDFRGKDKSMDIEMVRLNDSSSSDTLKSTRDIKQNTESKSDDSLVEKRYTPSKRSFSEQKQLERKLNNLEKPERSI